MSKELEKEIREVWFKDHIAVLTQHGDLQVLQWRKPGTSRYAVRFIFDQHMMYISGDLGSAVFSLTWAGTVDSFKDIYLGYFTSKLVAIEREKYYFDTEQAKNDLVYQYRKLLSRVEGCSSHEEYAWGIVNSDFNDLFHEIDSDYYEWAYDIGKVLNPVIVSYLVALKMAGEQLTVASRKETIEPTAEYLV